MNRKTCDDLFPLQKRNYAFSSRWKNMSTKEKGDELEKRVEKLFKQLGKWNVRRGIVITDRNGNISQIDVVYGIFIKKYVECKNYSNHAVPLSDVAKFKEVLALNNIPTSRGIFITTSSFVPRATNIGIHTIDGRQLLELERKAKTYSRFRLAFRCVSLLAIAAPFVGVGYYLLQPGAWQQQQQFKLQTAWRQLMFKKDECVRKWDKFWKDLISRFN